MPIDADAVGDALRASDAAIDAPSKTHHLLCRRESDVALVEELGGDVFHHVGGIYRIIADQV